MNKIKLILADIDGTIVPIMGTTPSDKVKEAVKKVQAQGVELVSVTGRPYETARDLFEHIGFRDLGVFDCGASVRKIETGEVVWQNWLSIERIKQILEVILPVSSVVDFFPEYREVDAKGVKLDDVVTEAPYVFALIKESQGEHALEKLRAFGNLSINVHYAHESWEGYLNVQITDMNASKFHAVEALRELVHSNIDETLAIGDSVNDVPLFKAAGVKVAMGNAIDELKALADYVVAGVDEDGFAEAMERFVLSES
jgi:HAD superfamily hydrolase (TIGR01484 family)